MAKLIGGKAILYRENIENENISFLAYSTVSKCKKHFKRHTESFFYIRFVERHWGVEIVRVEYFGLYISVLAVGFALKREKGGFSSCPSFHSGARSVWIFVCVERKL